MKQAFITLITLVPLTTTTVLGEDDSNETSSGLSLSQLESLNTNAFEMLDADDNGSITLNEIDLLKENTDASLREKLVLSNYRLRLRLIQHYFWQSEEEFSEFEVGDINNDGAMNRDEFENLHSNVRTHVLKLGLRSLDKDKNGSVEANEFAAHLASFEEWDEDDDGLLDRKEVSGITEHHVQIELHRPTFDRRGQQELDERNAVRERNTHEETSSRRLPPIFARGTAANIDELREASKNTFDLLDANDSGSIVLDEIDIIKELEEGEEKLPPEKLAQLRQRSQIISYTFMNIEERVDNFEVGDANHDGTLSETEFEQIGATVRRHILQLGLNSFDEDQGGSVDYGEFSAHLNNIEEIDTDGDGYISAEEMQDVTDFRLNMDVHVHQVEAFTRPRLEESQSLVR